MTEARLPLLLEPEQLNEQLGAAWLLLVDLSEPANYGVRHIPGAVNLPYQSIIRAAPPAMGELPHEAQLSEVLSAIGLSDETHVVAYDSEGNGRASRLLWTLDALGHPGYSLLNGGLAAWMAANLPLQSGSVDPRPSRYQARLRRPEAVADRDYLLNHLQDDAVVVLDARSAGEFRGQDKRAMRAGHIPGAVNLDWTATMDPTRQRRFLPDGQLRQMLTERGVTPDKEVVVHCQTHHRSAHTYVMLKHLGYERVRGYAGSWSEWGNREDTPVEQT